MASSVTVEQDLDRRLGDVEYWQGRLWIWVREMNETWGEETANEILTGWIREFQANEKKMRAKMQKTDEMLIKLSIPGDDGSESHGGDEGDEGHQCHLAFQKSLGMQKIFGPCTNHWECSSNHFSSLGILWAFFSVFTAFFSLSILQIMSHHWEFFGPSFRSLQLSSVYPRQRRR